MEALVGTKKMRAKTQKKESIDSDNTCLLPDKTKQTKSKKEQNYEIRVRRSLIELGVCYRKPAPTFTSKQVVSRFALQTLVRLSCDSSSSPRRIDSSTQWHEELGAYIYCDLILWQHPYSVGLPMTRTRHGALVRAALATSGLHNDRVGGCFRGLQRSCWRPHCPRTIAIRVY